MGNVNINQCCVSSVQDMKSEIETIKEKDEIKVKNQPIINHMNGIGYIINTDECAKSKIAKYFNYIKNRTAISFFLHKWRLDNLKFYINSNIYLIQI
mgnify:CR=1 FL=1